MQAPDFSVAGANVLVTGASQGIGQAIAETFAAAGADVAICSRSMDRVGPVADGINEGDGGRAVAYECDVREREDVEAFFAAAADDLGGLDVVVNNAGGEFVAAFEDISEGGWDAVTDLNLGGTYRCCQVAGEYLRESEGGDGGTILNMASVNGQHAAPGESHYGAAKAAIIRLTETLATEWDSDGVRVNCIAPGLVQTPGVAETLGIDESDMPPREKTSRRIGHPEEIADLAVFLASPAASFVDGETYTAKGVPRPGNSMSHDLGLER
ncbi:SDR family NAD(P)-dependent oxidoreductase [Halosegnis marinus]|uniref:SDR family NAD(P)-dependent oxidoreductase n=1 Tax=Halosegnis marinus TaxID=3034023 RepID=A0ABD5ZKE9_9EURY|nr:SDR family oxidoreductase [Halosegnis sp. DT85]